MLPDFNEKGIDNKIRHGDDGKPTMKNFLARIRNSKPSRQRAMKISLKSHMNRIATDGSTTMNVELQMFCIQAALICIEESKS